MLHWVMLLATHASLGHVASITCFTGSCCYYYLHNWVMLLAMHASLGHVASITFFTGSCCYQHMLHHITSSINFVFVIPFYLQSVLVQEECIVSNEEVGTFSFLGPCRLYIHCNSQDDFHHRGHVRHHSINFIMLLLQLT
jgi:hypothetical protein